MFWTGVVLFVVAWAVVLLVWASCAVAREGDEALEELDESLRKLQQVAASVTRTSDRSAELVRRRAQPIRYLLEGLEDDVIQPQRR
jgi:outer membrane lipoprotein-sorting protein